MLYYLSSIALCVSAFFIVLAFFNGIAFSKKSGVFRALLCALLSLAAGAFQLFYALPAANYAVFGVFSFLILIICFEIGFSKAIAYSLLSLLLFIVSDSAVGIVFSLVDLQLTSDDLSLIVPVAFSRLLFLVLTRLSLIILKKAKGESEKYPIYFFLYPVSAAILLSLISKLLEMIVLSSLWEIIVSCTILLTLGSIILTFFLFEKSAERDALLQTLRSEIREAKISTEYNSVIEAQNDRLRELAHDEKNHLEVIAALTSEKQVRDYISSIQNDIEPTMSFGTTKNKLLDLLIEKYRIISEKKGIRFSSNIKTANLDFISDPDLTSLVGNILDNAVEAAERSEEKVVELDCNMSNGMTVLTCRNSCDRSPEMKGGYPVTSKKEKEFHGSGMKIIRRIARKYRGDLSFSFSEEKREFILNIVFNR